MSKRQSISRRAFVAGAGVAAGVAAMMPGGLPQAAAAAAEDGLGQIPAWDAHTHLTGVSGSIPERVAKLLKFADRMNVQRMVMFMGRNPVAHPTPDEFRRQNDDDPPGDRLRPQRVMGFVYLNPQHVKESLAEMDRCVRDGPMIGIKLWIALECSRPELDPIAERAGELQIPILQHAYWRTAGNWPGESAPSDVAALAARHPRVSFICAHSGNDWERGFRAIRAVEERVGRDLRLRSHGRHGGDGGPRAGGPAGVVRQRCRRPRLRLAVGQSLQRRDSHAVEAFDPPRESAETAGSGPGGQGGEIMIIDVNVNLSRWPFRRVPCDETPRLVEALRRGGVQQAWAGTLDGLFHRDVAAANARLAESAAAAPGPAAAFRLRQPHAARLARRCSPLP